MHKADPPTVKLVIQDLKKHGTPAKAEVAMRFFKTGKGEYGEGDVFLGVTVPEQRKIAKHYQLLPYNEVKILLNSPIHECRLTALFILVRQYERAESQEQKRIARLYLANRKRINNWDLVDSSAPQILGNYLFDKDSSILYRLARSKNIWERRIAIIATFAFIKRGRYDETLVIAGVLLHDRHDLIHKAVGWMLREVGKTSPKEEELFLKKHAHHMPRTMLRYAIEKFSEAKRKQYLSMR